MVAMLQNIVVAGGGIVGTSIAYFLAKRNVPVILVDPVGIAPGASSKAGGFLAKDWRDGTPLEEIQQQGFYLHQEIANELGEERIGYRRLTCVSVAIQENEEEEETNNICSSSSSSSNIAIGSSDTQKQK